MAAGVGRLVAWRGPDPERVDTAQVVLSPDSLVAHGTSTTAAYALDWSLTTGTAWATRTLSVRARGDGWQRGLLLERSPKGTWTATRREGTGPPRQISLAALDLDGALDCDLGLCPFTNTMPVLRHDLVAAARRGDERSVDLVMAWVSVPELEVTASAQAYSARGPADGGHALIGFECEGFQTTIEFDADGLVQSYPDIGWRVV